MGSAWPRWCRARGSTPGSRRGSQAGDHFDQVHGNYLEKLSISNIRLSPREIKLAAFLRMNMSSKEISKLLNITTRSVELARYRLRKKLNLKREQNLVEFLIDLDNSWTILSSNANGK